MQNPERFLDPGVSRDWARGQCHRGLPAMGLGGKRPMTKKTEPEGVGNQELFRTAPFGSKVRLRNIGLLKALEPDG